MISVSLNTQESQEASASTVTKTILSPCETRDVLPKAKQRKDLVKLRKYEVVEVSNLLFVLLNPFEKSMLLEMKMRVMDARCAYLT